MDETTLNEAIETTTPEVVFQKFVGGLSDESCGLLLQVLNEWQEQTPAERAEGLVTRLTEILGWNPLAGSNEE